MIKWTAYKSLLLAVFIGLPAMPLYAADVSEAEVKAVEEQAQARRMEHKRLQAQALQLSLELAKINENMIQAARQLQGDEEKTTKMENELTVLEQQLAQAKADFERENTNLIQTLAALQNLALHPNQALLVQPLAPVEMVRSALLMRQSVPYLSERAQKIQQDLQEIDQRQKKVQTQLEKIQSQRDSLKKQQNALQKMSAQKNQMRQEIEGKSEKTKQEAENLASQAADLRDLWEKIEREREIQRRRDEEIRRAARQREEKARQAYLEEQRKQKTQGSTASAPKSQDNGLINPTAGATNGKGADFASARGKLVNPARGTVITAYGQELSKGVTSKGMVMQTRQAAQVIAPYDGSVVFSGPFKGYGNLIIIDHGKGYMSLLAGMASVEAETGQMVLAGEPVGIMPEDGLAKLYIEIRKDKLPVNPAPWFGN